MFCPNCGTNTSPGLKFCRSCGLGLDKVAQTLAEQIPQQLNDNVQARKQRLERLGVGLLSIFGAGVLGLILYGVVYKSMIVNGRIWEGLGILGFLTIIACGLIAVYLFAEANETEEKVRKQQLEQPAKLSTPETTGKLLSEPDFEPVPSVTERTTDLLVAEERRKIRRD